MKRRSRRSIARFSPSSTNPVIGPDISDHPPADPVVGTGGRVEGEEKPDRETEQERIRRLASMELDKELEDDIAPPVVDQQGFRPEDHFVSETEDNNTTCDSDDDNNNDQIVTDTDNNGNVEAAGVDDSNDSEGAVDDGINDEPEEPPQKKRKSTSKRKRREKYAKYKKSQTEKFEAAMADYRAGKFSSIRKTAAHYGIDNSHLSKLLRENKEYVGQGRKSNAFPQEMELKLKEHLVWMMEIGFGLTHCNLKLLCQNLMEAMLAADPEAETPWKTKDGEATTCPPDHFVYNFCERHGFVLKSSMELSHAKSVLTPADLRLWQRDTYVGLVSKFLDLFRDPRRLHNQVR